MPGKSRLEAGSLLWLLLAFDFSGRRLVLENPYVAGTSSEHSRACDQLTCRIGEQCVSRKFWCDRPPCPSMTYCSKSRKELLKGPKTCESVVCGSGYKCLVRVRDCEWNKKCKERTARCVSEREYEEGPANCADVVCPSGHRCVLRETHCYRPPCKLTKSCARDRDVTRWFDKCRKLGCRSEHNCFLRRPPTKCSTPPCDHVPDCLDTDYFNTDDEADSSSSSSAAAAAALQLDERCRGWICPVNQECIVVHAGRACDGKGGEDDCRVVRSCRESILLPVLDARAGRDSGQIRADEIFSEITPTRDWLGLKNNPSYATAKTTAMTTISTTTTKASSSGGASFDDSAWLTYLRRKAGAETVQYWIEKAKTSQEYEGFSDWLETVAKLLGPDTYRLWLSEVELASLDAPEFQAWLASARANNHWPPILARPRHRLTSNDRTASPVGRKASFPARNVYHDVDDQEDNDAFDPVGSGTNPKPAYQLPPPVEQESLPAGAPAHASGLENTSNQQSHSKPSNFNFNGATRSGPTPPGIQNVSFPYLSGQQQLPVKDPPELSSRIPGFEAREFGDSVKNSWKSWQSYYQLQPGGLLPASSLPPANPSGVRALSSSSQRDSFYLSNYTRVRQNYSIAPELAASSQISQTRVFFPSDGKYGRDDEPPNRWLQSQAMPRDASPPLPKTMEERPGTQTPPATTAAAYGKSTEEPKSAGIGSILDSVSGFQQFNQVKPSILKLSPNQALQMLPPKNPDLDGKRPNFLIYFPPPFNFLIYYSDIKSPDHGSDILPEVKTTTTTTTTTGSPSTSETAYETSPRSQEKVTLSPNDRTTTDTSTTIATTTVSTKEKLERQRRREYIRKLLKELLQYWDEEEKSYWDNAELPTTSDSDGHKNDEDGSRTSNDKTNVQSSRSNLTASSTVAVDDDTPFDQFLEWLTRNTSLLDLKPRRKGPPNYNETYTEDYENTTSLESSSLPSPRKVRILVDIDKNPELMKVLFSRNESETKSKANEYQVIVNLEDYVDPQEEELISRKLIDIVKYQLHRNLTRAQQMPKSLWVFPVYDGEDNKTTTVVDAPGDFRRANNADDHDQVLTLKDVDFPTDAQSNGDFRSGERDIDDVEMGYEEDRESYAESKVHQVTSRYKMRRYGG